MTEKPPISDPKLLWVERMSKLMDSKFSVFGIRFGLDPIMSLVPVLGDASGFIVSAVLISTMYKHGASGKVVVRMILNALLDAIVGVIPVVGTIFDLTYKANDRNVQLLKEHYTEGKHRGSGLWLILLVLGGIMLVLVGIFWLIGQLLGAIFGGWG